MVIRFSHLITIALATVVSTLVASSALAQTAPSEYNPKPIRSIPDAFDEAFFQSEGDFFEINSIGGQLNTIFGWRAFPNGALSFPENDIARDGEFVNILYREIMEQQNASAPLLRTRDLNNPFNTSLKENPSYLGNPENTNNPVVIEEIFWE